MQTCTFKRRNQFPFPIMLFISFSLSLLQLPKKRCCYLNTNQREINQMYLCDCRAGSAFATVYKLFQSHGKGMCRLHLQFATD